MEKKFILKDSGEPVKVGSIITIHREVTTSYGKASETHTFPITEANLESLIKNGIILVKKEQVNTKQPSEEIESYIEGLASKIGWDYNKTVSFLNKLMDIYEPAVYSMLAKVIAKRLDKKYEGHISEAKEIWIISLTDCSAHLIDKADNTNFDNFAAFRSKEDAELAIKILKPHFKDMYGK